MWCKECGASSLYLSGHLGVAGTHMEDTVGIESFSRGSALDMLLKCHLKEGEND